MTQSLLHQLSSHHVQRLLRCEPANAGTVAREVALNHLCPAFSGQSMEYQSNWLFCRAASWAGDSGDSKSQRGSAAFTDSFSQSFCNLLAYRAEIVEYVLRHVCEFHLQFIRKNDGATDEIA